MENWPVEHIDQLGTALREDLHAYTPASIRALIGEQAWAAIERVQSVPAHLACQEIVRQEDSTEGQLAESQQAEKQLALQILFLLLGKPLDVQDFALAFPKVNGRSELRAMMRDEKTGSPHFMCQAHEVELGTSVMEHSATVLIASDLGELAGLQPQSNHVMPVGHATRTLANIITYVPGRPVADIGTGSGFHAICAALSGYSVTATDISRRALAFARLNAAMAGVEIDLREGSLCEPLEGTYGTIISNPPFVITPGSVRAATHFEYRDGGMPGDTLIEQLISQATLHLDKGARLYLLFNAEIPEGGEWDARPKEWARRAGLDAWVLGRDEIPPEMYVEMWLRDGGYTPAHPEYENLYAAWLQDFRARKVRAIAAGYAIFGTPEKQNTPEKPGAVYVAHQLTGPLQAGLNHYLQRCWNNRHLAISPDSRLLSTRLENVGTVEHRYYRPGSENPLQILLTQSQGTEDSVMASSALAAIVGACDGELPVEQLCEALAHIWQEPVENIVEQVLPGVRELVELGMLVENLDAS